MTMYDVSAISAADDIDNTLTSIDSYTESVIDYIDLVESSLVIEGTADKPESDGTIFNKIISSIKSIFEKMIFTIQKGKVAVHGKVQRNKLDDIAMYVKGSPDITIKLQDVWKYSSFIDDLVEERIRKFKRKETLGLFRKVVGEGRAIDVLIRNIDLMTSQMKEPSNKQFYTKGRSPKPTDGVKRTTKPLPLPARVVRDVAVIKYGTAATKAVLSSEPAMVAKNLIISVGIGGPLVANAAVIIGGAAGLFAISRLFSNCPRKIGTETISLKELYNRLVSLAPDKFPGIVKADLQNAAMYMTRIDNLKEFAIANDDSRDSSTVDYARKIAHLLGSYAKFHQALIDFYLSIVISILNETGNISSKKIYKPTEMVKLENSNDETSNYYELTDILVE